MPLIPDSFTLGLIQMRCESSQAANLDKAVSAVHKAAGASQREAWELIQRSHAIANGVFVAAVNRVGHEGSADAGIEFWGSSFVSDPFGVVLGQAAETEEGVVIVPCDRRRLEDVRRNWPFLRDRRIDAYGDLTRRMIG